MSEVASVNQYIPVVSPEYGYNQLPRFQPIDPTTITWSIMTDMGGDLPCSSKLNDLLNTLSPLGVIHYKINGYNYTTKKVNPYTAIQINDMTKQERTLKSSVCICINYISPTKFDYLM